MACFAQMFFVQLEGASFINPPQTYRQMEGGESWVCFVFINETVSDLCTGKTASCLVAQELQFLFFDSLVCP